MRENHDQPHNGWSKRNLTSYDLTTRLPSTTTPRTPSWSGVWLSVLVLIRVRYYRNACWLARLGAIWLCYCDTISSKAKRQAFQQGYTLGLPRGSVTAPWCTSILIIRAVKTVFWPKFGSNAKLGSFAGLNSVYRTSCRWRHRTIGCFIMQARLQTHSAAFSSFCEPLLTDWSDGKLFRMNHHQTVEFGLLQGSKDGPVSSMQAYKA